jgi:hypothetical protein
LSTPSSSSSDHYTRLRNFFFSFACLALEVPNLLGLSLAVLVESNLIQLNLPYKYGAVPIAPYQCLGKYSQVVVCM